MNCSTPGLPVHHQFPEFTQSWRLITLQYCDSFCHRSNQPQVYMFHPTLRSHPLPSPLHPSGLSQSTSPEWPASCIEPALVIYLHTCFSAILSNHPTLTSLTESKSLFLTSVSLLLSCILGRQCHLSKFHIYALIFSPLSIILDVDLSLVTFAMLK